MTPRRPFFIPLQLILLVGPMFFFSGCSLPRIIILHDPLSSEEHANLGRIYETKGEPELAREQYRAALSRDPKHLPSLLLLGDLSYRTQAFGEAESAYAKALDLDRGNSDVRNNLAWVYLRTNKKLRRARDLITEALTLSPEHRPYYLDTLGVVLIALGEAPEAIPVLRESVATLPKDRRDLLAEAVGHLADACKAAGDEAGYAEASARQRALQNQVTFSPALQTP